MCLATLAKENKEVYICGDFNLDLLKIDTDHFTQYFFNLLCSYGLLPHVLQPTRVKIQLQSLTTFLVIFSG